MTRCELDKLADISANAFEIDGLSDILKADIRGANAIDRLTSMIDQINNPYCFKVGKRPVRIMFKQGERSIEEKLRTHFLSLKQSS